MKSFKEHLKEESHKPSASKVVLIEAVDLDKLVGLVKEITKLETSMHTGFSSLNYGKQFQDKVSPALDTILYAIVLEKLHQVSNRGNVEPEMKDKINKAISQMCYVANWDEEALQEEIW